MTIKDLARIAGVSYSTVSRALNDNPRIGLDTRERIKALAELHRFEFNAGARSLASKRTGSIAVIYGRDLEIFGNSLYTNQLFLDLRHSLEVLRLDSILLQPFNPATGNGNIGRLIRQGKVDGFLIVDAGVSREEYELIRRADLAVVQLHLPSTYYPMDSLDYFVTDNVTGGEMACRHLIAEGCERILCLGSGPGGGGQEFAQRAEGYRRALAGAGLCRDPELSVDAGGCSFDAGYGFVLANEELVRSVDGIFACADILGVGCVAALAALGIEAPGAVKVIGFDDCAVCSMCRPALSSVRQPREELARRAAARLAALLAGADGAPEQVVLEPSLVVRGSSKQGR
ncbi:MAG: LacI family DNA-binding transcriptional regulator [Spirochaetaceae bacterium]|nr:LacI family DNA-binding transcriptional regulator [Spirochaetaceae bacterium]